MGITKERLHPIDWVAPEPPVHVGGRNVAAARALIEAAVPEGGEPMDVDDLVTLVCGGYLDRSVLHKVTAYKERVGDLSGCPHIMAVDDDNAAAIAATRARTPVVIKGPDACRYLGRRRVRILIRNVIAERSPEPAPEPLILAVEPK